MDETHSHLVASLIRGFGHRSVYSNYLHQLQKVANHNPPFSGPFTEREVFDHIALKPFLDFRSFGVNSQISAYKFIEIFGPFEMCRLFGSKNLEQAHHTQKTNKWEIHFHSIGFSNVSQKMMIFYIENEEQIRYFVRPTTTLTAMNFYSFMLTLSLARKSACYTEEFDYKSNKMHTFTFSKEKVITTD